MSALSRAAASDLGPHEMPIDELIAKSSNGAGIANIRENGIESELKRIDGEMAPKKRKKSTSPTARTLAECRRRGWIAGVVERHIPFPKPMGTKIDLFGVIDVVVIVPPITRFHPRSDHDGGGRCIACSDPGSILAIQATASAAHHAHRRDKILAEPRAKAWVDAGGRLELWSWSKRGAAGKRKAWQLRVETYEEMLASREVPQ